MRVRISLCTTAVVLLAAWLAVTMVGRAGDTRFVLEVPATYLSVGQQFQPRLVSLAASTAIPDMAVSLALFDAGGQRVQAQQLDLAATATTAAAPMALPRAGSYQLRASAGGGEQTIALQALDEPSLSYAGVLPVAAMGLEAGVADYLLQHSFAIQDLAHGTGARLILLGDPRLDGGDLAAQYSALWQRVAAGATALALKLPPPGVAPYWPIPTALTTPPGACGEDVFDSPLANGLSSGAALTALLRPALVFDLAHPDPPDVYRWDGRLILRPNARAGYPGCHALFSFRYGDGWVTVSALPLLQHFQDVRARVYLMNLIMASVRRKRPAPSAPGLQWVTERRLQRLAVAPAPNADAAVFYRPPPGPVEPAPVLVPAASDGELQSCWDAPAVSQSGATLELDLRAPRPVHTLILDFGSGAADTVPGFQLMASPDGRRWSPLPPLAPAPGGQLTLPLPEGAWQAFRLTVGGGAPAGAWRLCRFAAQ
ncbi:MAG: discoidin domain-containing protein [Terriglobales bacterium]